MKHQRPIPASAYATRRDARGRVTHSVGGLAYMPVNQIPERGLEGEIRRMKQEIADLERYENAGASLEGMRSHKAFPGYENKRQRIRDLDTALAEAHAMHPHGLPPYR